MKEFQLTVVTFEKIIYNENVENVVVRTLDGDIGILKGHEPFVAPLQIGKVRIKTGGEWKTAACMGGMVYADKESVKIVANAFEWSDEINIARAENAKSNAEKTITSSQDSKQLDKAKIKLLRAITRINVANNK